MQRDMIQLFIKIRQRVVFIKRLLFALYHSAVQKTIMLLIVSFRKKGTSQIYKVPLLKTFNYTLSYAAMALPLMRSIALRIPIQTEISVNTSTMLP